MSVYSASKAAVIAYTRAMNKELAGDGIKSVAFCPGFVDTDMSEFVKAQIPAEQIYSAANPDGIRGQQVRDNLEAGRIANLQERLADGHH